MFEIKLCSGTGQNQRAEVEAAVWQSNFQPGGKCGKFSKAFRGFSHSFRSWLVGWLISIKSAWPATRDLFDRILALEFTQIAQVDG